jgi:hypothetical protein
MLVVGVALFAVVLSGCGAGSAGLRSPQRRASPTVGQPAEPAETHPAREPARGAKGPAPEESGAEGPEGSAPEEPGASEPTESAPEYAALSKYRQRCHHITTSGARAHVVYPPKLAMTRGNGETVTAGVTLSKTVDPERVLHASGGTAAPAIVVSCVLDARLRGSTSSFSIDDGSWQARSFLTGNTVRWTWSVGPKIGGSQTLLLDVRPIVSIRSSKPEGESASDLAPEDATVETYPIKVRVNVPWTERPAELMSRLAGTLKVAQSLVEALTGLVTAAVALLAALGIRKARAKRQESAPAGAHPGAGGEPSA